jgi:hypothetical protein
MNNQKNGSIRNAYSNEKTPSHTKPTPIKTDLPTIKKFKVLDIYGNVYYYSCENKQNAIDCFIAENGKNHSIYRVLKC